LEKSDWAGVAQAIRNHGGGFVNHELFFLNMAPPSEGKGFKPELNVAKLVTETYGSLENFKKLFLEAATKVFGSGWAFLVYLPKTKKLEIVSTQNQDIPEFVPAYAGSGAVSILGLDVWEHVM
jgi:Fe-Mn family superoxide dismutase